MPTIKVSDEMYALLEDKRRRLLVDKLSDPKHERVKVTFEDVLKQMDEDIRELNDECNGLIKQLQGLGVRPYWTEEVKTE